MELSRSRVELGRLQCRAVNAHHGMHPARQEPRPGHPVAIPERNHALLTSISLTDATPAYN